MNVLSFLRQSFQPALAGLATDPDSLLDMIRPAQDAKFGDYQANFAMPLGKQLERNPRDVARQVIEQIDLSQACETPEIAGPGFINLRLQDDWLIEQLTLMVADPRLGVAATTDPKKYVVDYSSPNVAKPMHVGHIRTTVIGDAICRTLRFLGHDVISDNHLGDWGTQFGMVIYGYKHFADQAHYASHPVAELARLYKLVNQLVEYHDARGTLPEKESNIEQLRQQIDQLRAADAPDDKSAAKKRKKELRRCEAQLSDLEEERDSLSRKLDAVQSDSELQSLADQHQDIGRAVLQETAKLHAGDDDNQRLWREFLPKCREDIERIYRRLGIQFDYEHGESFYHDMLHAVVEQLEGEGFATQSDGATCIFLEGFDTPMIIRKQDGAFLYATTDLATVYYRMQQWQPDAVLYVVDHRQSEHFEKLFAAVRLWGFQDVQLRHISFGTVLGEDKKPFKTRSGTVVGLEGLLDEAVSRALQVVSQNDDAKPNGPELNQESRQDVAEAVGLGAIRYADLSHNRTSDYVFSYDKMLALEGNTATYLQYSYARIQSIFDRGEVDVEGLRASFANIQFSKTQERALALQLIRFEESLCDAIADFRLNLLTSYLFDLSKCFAQFFEACPVLKAESDALRASRLLLCDLTARTIKQGMQLLGIRVVDRM